MSVEFTCNFGLKMGFPSVIMRITCGNEKPAWTLSNAFLLMVARCAHSIGGICDMDIWPVGTRLRLTQFIHNVNQLHYCDDFCLLPSIYILISSRIPTVIDGHGHSLTYELLILHRNCCARTDL